MCGAKTIYQPSDRPAENRVQNGIGELFRHHGEAYIKAYEPSLQQIKLIRAIRVCKTPALGAIVYTCAQCGNKHIVYKSCGHSHCMICQSIKREQWIDKLSAKLLKAPYLHLVCTMPHQLNGLARANPKVIYNFILKATWMTVQKVNKQLDIQPGMTSVLHTFGSDMKYHIHTHSLVTFGGINANGHWIYPTDKHKMASYRVMCHTFRDIFIDLLTKANTTAQLHYHSDIKALIDSVAKLRWIVHSTRPTMHTETIKTYMARYINRVAITNNRLTLAADKSRVSIVYNDYKSQVTGQPAPKETKELDPLIAIHMIMQHVLPPHFQKCRHNGLHAASNKRKSQANNSIKQNAQTIRTIFKIITELLGATQLACEKCKHETFEISAQKPDKSYILQFLDLPNKSPPSPINILPINSIPTQFVHRKVVSMH
jgi:hypothetical protein